VEAEMVAVTGTAAIVAAIGTMPDLAPAAILIEAGTVTVAALLVKLTVVPPVGAAPARTTAQLTLVPPISVVVGQLMKKAGETAICCVFVTLPKAAINVVVPVVEAWAVAENCAVEAPGAIRTEVGDVTTALLREIATSVLAIAAFVRVTTHVLTAPFTRLAGVQTTDCRAGAAPRPTVPVTLLPANVAVIRAVELTVKLPALPTNATEEAPAGTTTVAGTVRRALSLTREIDVLAGAEPIKVTEQLPDVPGASEAGVHETADTWAAPPTGLRATAEVNELPRHVAVTTAFEAVVTGTGIQMSRTAV
jgi:hypothetical protein